MTLAELNQLPAAEAERELLRCCGSKQWAAQVTAHRPYATRDDLIRRGAAIWQGLGERDWLEAFSHHPRIGAKVSDSWARQEQAGTAHADAATQEALRGGNIEYEKKFGFVFLVCATGKTANEMLQILQTRLPRTRAEEIVTAAGEQSKITQIRLEKWLT